MPSALGSPPPCGEGLGVGVKVGRRVLRNNDYPPPQPSPSRLRACPLPARLNVPEPRQAAVRLGEGAHRAWDALRGQSQNCGVLRRDRAARSRHPRGDPQCAAGGGQRDGGGSPADLVQHDDLRGPRLLYRSRPARRGARQPERRRRLAFRRGSRRDRD